EAAELDAALEGFDVDLRRLEHRFIEDRCLHRSGDGGVVDVLAGALVSLRRSATREGRQGDGGEQDRYATEFVHDEFLQVMSMDSPVKYLAGMADRVSHPGEIFHRAVHRHYLEKYLAG